MKNDTENNMQLSDQALGAVMMALQKSLMEQTDIVPVLKGMKFKLSETGLVVMNPPIVKASAPTVTTTESDSSFVVE
tara:strand:+ start:69 stop:299 length:231 start_codon:yes stop_codon:yes gene_type:complete